jgi:hypothetical protein
MMRDVARLAQLVRAAAGDVDMLQRATVVPPPVA